MVPPGWTAPRSICIPGSAPGRELVVIKPRELRDEDLESLRGRAHEYIHGVNRPVRSRELSRALFRRRSSAEISSLMIRTLLGTDSRFHEPRQGTWQLAASTHLQQPLDRTRFVVVDLEATGSDPRSDQLIEVGMVRIDGLEVTSHYASLVRPTIPIPIWIQRLTGIGDEKVENAPPFEEIAGSVLDQLEDAVFVAHNVDFDHPFLFSHLRAEGHRPPHCSQLCTVRLARRLLPEAPSFRLDSLADQFGVPLQRHHRAIDDARATANILLELITRLRGRGVTSLGELLEIAAGSSPSRRPSAAPPSSV